MSDCTRKLRQERGASVVFALVIFLIVTLFSWTMVNGALTAAQNASMQREEEQAYLSVTSAARLFCHEAGIPIPFEMSGPAEKFHDGNPFDGAFYWDNRPDKIWKIYRDSNPIEIVGGRLTYDDTVSAWIVNYPNNLLIPDAREVSFIHKTFLEMVEAIDRGADAPQTQPLTMTCPKPSDDNDAGASDIEVFNQVQTKVTMNPDYSVTVEFENVKPDGGSIPQNLKCYVTVTLKCTPEETRTVSGNLCTYQRSMTWEVKSVERGRHS